MIGALPKLPKGAKWSSPQGAFIRRIAADPPDECVLWPYAKNSGGYGHYRKQRAHRLALIVYAGPPESSALVAAHECGTPLCMNPVHINWKTQAENLIDKRQHGTWGSRYTEDDIRAIRADTRSVTEIAKSWGTSIGAISNIRQRIRWKWLA